jgi:hypothetical protein
VWAASADGASRNRLIISASNFDVPEVGLNFTIAGSRIDLESRLVRYVDLDVALTVIDLHAAQFIHMHFHRSVFIIQADIAGHAIEANVFRSRGQAQRPSKV